jgi:ABC-2 type transport system ATP-binding protein
VPVVLESHGWGGSRSTSPSGIESRLLKEGYALFTWDERGFGQSGGEAEIDSPQFEVKDVTSLIDWLGRRSEIQKDGPDDPRAGWIGGSYAGGIQLNTEAYDHRVDALVPEIPWANLVQDLYPNGVLKKSWDQLLYAAGAATATEGGLNSPAGPQTGVYAPEIHEAEVIGTATGSFPKDLEKWFYEKSTLIRSQNVTAPTMIMQGTIDTLFPSEDGFAQFQNIRAAGTPVKLVTFCGGHSLEGCPYPGGASGYGDSKKKGSHYDDLIVNWLNHYVKGETVPIGPSLEWEAQDGHYYGSRSFPLPGTSAAEGKPVSATLVGPGGTGGDSATAGQPASGSELGSTGAQAEILGASKKAIAMVGVPQLHISGTMTAAVDGDLFFELLDKAPDGTLTTVDAQTTPVRLASGKIDTTLSMHGADWLLLPRHSLELEVTTGSTQYDVTRTGPYSASIKVIPELPLTTDVGQRTS